jgi:5-methylcytosine-specific restriction enzyme subunit McrC
MNIQVREYARLTTNKACVPSIDMGVISQQTFNWLTTELKRPKQSLQFWKYDSPDTLKLKSFVGYLESPNGESIEILPKTNMGKSDLEQERLLLRRMLRSINSIPSRDTGPADLLRMDLPIHEWVLSQFLMELKTLIKVGFRFDYEQIEEESLYLRGQLNVARQQRQPPSRAHQLHIRHDVFSPNRIENQLIKTALIYILKITKDSENWRLANELNHYLEDIQSLRNPLSVIETWTHSKLMQAYVPIKPWCFLILDKLNPNFQKGAHRGVSLLFPMERLFEKYVANHLRKELLNNSKMKAPAKSKNLVKHVPKGKDQKDWFQLQPDILLWDKQSQYILDTKWKLIREDLDTSTDKYGVSQNDMYQMLAYGQCYQMGKGNMMLIYPKHSGFSTALNPFRFNDALTLWIVPFCLESAKLIDGEWADYFPIKHN